MLLLPNMMKIIQSHNRTLLRNDSTVEDCKSLKKNKHKCLLAGKFNTENFTYKATVTSYNCVKTYIRSTGQSFKKRWYGLFRIANSKCIPCKAIRDSTSSSNSRDSRDSSNSNLFCTHGTPMQCPTTLAGYVRKLKRNVSSYNIKWNILQKISRHKSYQNACRVYNLKKTEIACEQGKN